MTEHGSDTEGTRTPAVRRPEQRLGRLGRVLSGTGRLGRVFSGTGRRRTVAVLATAALGFGGAAAVDAFAADGPVLASSVDLGPAGDGLTRLVVTAATGTVTADQLAALQAAPGVVSVQRVFDGSALVATRGLAPADLTPVVPGADVQLSETGTFSGRTVSDPYWASYGYNLANTGANAFNQAAVAGADVDAPTGWAAGTGTGMVVAITDSGMDTSHPDLQGALWTNPDCATDADGDGLVGDCHGWNFYAGSADIVNAGGNVHGTGVAGIAAARAGNGEGSAGVAPGVQVMPLVVGYGSSVDITAAAAAIHYAVDHGADVVNASWGGAGTTGALTAAIDYANSHGVLVVAAAGNDGADRETAPLYPASSTSPAVLTVGASTASDTVASFSGYGRVSVDLFAPGTGIVSPSPGGGYSAMDGTSMAAPEVAAAVALYRAHYPDASLPQLRQQLLDDTQKVAAFTGRSVSGGRLSLTALGNTAAAVQYTFTAMSSDAGAVAPHVVVSGSTPATGDYTVRLGLGEEYGGELYALSGQAVTLGGVTASTDDTGEVGFDLGQRTSAGPSVLSPVTQLAAARYALTVQLYRDGTPVGLRVAAPLLVGQPTSAPTTSAGSTSSTPTSTRASTPATTTSATTPAATTSAAASTTRPALPSGGSAAPTVVGGSTTGASTPGSTTSATSPAAGSTTAAPTGSTAPTTSGGAATPTATSRATTPTGTSTGTPTGTSAPTTSAPTTSAPTTSAGRTTSAPSSSAGSTSAPTVPGGSTTYPATGPWGLTSISPTRVSVAGGTAVTITGSAIPAGARVLVGDTAQAVVVSSSATTLVFTAPARVAGSYDVRVFDAAGTQSAVLTGGLTYLASAGSTSAPTTTAAPTTTPITTPATTPTTTPVAAAPSWVTGPHGERLVHSAVFGPLQTSLWKVGCTTACSGIPV